MAYILTLVYALVVIGLVVFRLRKMGQRVRSSLQALVYRDGIIFLIMAFIPTLLAVALFYTGKTAPAQSATMTLSATLHALLATRAYRNLSDLCERLPISMRFKVSNGTKLDEDTLGRIAFIMGSPRDMHMEQGRSFEQHIPPPPFDTGCSLSGHENKTKSSSPTLSMHSLQVDSTSCTDTIHIVTHQQVSDESSSL